MRAERPVPGPLDRLGSGRDRGRQLQGQLGAIGHGNVVNMLIVNILIRKLAYRKGAIVWSGWVGELA